MKNVILNYDNVMQSKRMAFWHPLGLVFEWPWNSHDVVDDGLFILCCEESPVNAKSFILEPVPGEFW